MATRPRIDQLQPGQEVTLRFHAKDTLGNNSHEEVHTFLGIEGAGNDRRAIFTNGTQWEAYRHEGGWAYGSSADKLTLVSVI